MIKVSVMYPNKEGSRFDHDYYRDKHMPLLKARMGDHCKFYTVDKGQPPGSDLKLRASVDLKGVGQPVIRPRDINIQK